ncbi:MAG: family 10 glycosylhydrolase [Thermonemataceae bacterium]|nr:family 10 glycosylhydrolase [Thermonemataceae bacterium]
MTLITKYFTLLMFLCGFFEAKGQSLHPRREMRAVWISTVGNIDWPSRKGLSTENQKREYIALLEQLQKNNFNAVITQVRPAADAIYESSYEPWSEVLQGKQGLSPKPYYDPLAWMLVESKKRNLEFHAWVNPFRAVSSLNFSNIHPNHISKSKPEWFFKYGDRLYFNPGIPEVRQYIITIIMEIILKYDIDGLHFDDYFYPYQITGERINDDDTFDKFGENFRNIEDWRRNNIDTFIQAVSDSIKKHKPRLKFGISPAGGWRNQSKDPRGSATRVGQPSYDHLYADTRKWLEKGWIDYLAPQLYWTTQSKYASYQTLIEWWNKNTFGRHIYGGQGAFKVGSTDDEFGWRSPEEFLKQIMLNRKHTNVKGSIFFSAKPLLKNPLNVLDSLQEKYYKYPAFVPQMPWKDALPPLPPKNLKATYANKRIALKWQAPENAKDGEKPTYYVVFRFDNELKINTGDVSAIVTIQRQTDFYDFAVEEKRNYIYVVKSFDRLHNESRQYARVKIATIRKLTMPSPIKDDKQRPENEQNGILEED